MRLVLALLAGLGVMAGASPHAQAGVAVQVVVDASGSMWGQLGGVSKIDLVRRGVGSALKAHPTVPAGLTVFGSGSGPGCSDLVTAVAPALDQPGAIDTFISTMNPRGTAPLVAALRKARTELEGVGGLDGPGSQALVIALVDGGDACVPEPCAKLAANWSDSGPAIHVLGLGVRDPEITEQLTCMAEAGGGQYRAVRSRSEVDRNVRAILSDALRREREAILAAERAAAEAERMRAATRLELRFSAALDSTLCEHIEVETTTVDGERVEGLPETIPCRGETVIFEEIAEPGEHELTFAYWKVRKLGRLLSRRVTTSFRIEPGKTTRIELEAKPRLMSYDVEVTVEVGAEPLEDAPAEAASAR